MNKFVLPRIAIIAAAMAIANAGMTTDALARGAAVAAISVAGWAVLILAQ